MIQQLLVVCKVLSDILALTYIGTIERRIVSTFCVPETGIFVQISRMRLILVLVRWLIVTWSVALPLISVLIRTGRTGDSSLH